MSSRDWDAYFAATETERPLRPLFVEALAAYPSGEGLGAVDLGFGHGVETRALLHAGFEVYAVDGAPEARARLVARVTGAEADRLTAVVSDLADAEVPAYDLLWAGFSLFFVQSARFDSMWSRILGAARPGGRFAGQLLGVNDTWAADDDTSVFTRDQVLALFEGWSVEHVDEVDEDGSAVSGPKHWHLFHVLARAPAT